MRLCQTLFNLHKCGVCYKVTNVELMQLAFLNTSSEPTAAKSSSAASWRCSSSCDLCNGASKICYSLSDQYDHGIMYYGHAWYCVKQGCQYT